MSIRLTKDEQYRLMAEIDSLTPEQVQELAAETVRKFDKEWGIDPTLPTEFVSFRTGKIEERP